MFSKDTGCLEHDSVEDSEISVMYINFLMVANIVQNFVGSVNLVLSFPLGCAYIYLFFYSYILLLVVSFFVRYFDRYKNESSETVGISGLHLVDALSITWLISLLGRVWKLLAFPKFPGIDNQRVINFVILNGSKLPKNLTFVF